MQGASFKCKARAAHRHRLGNGTLLIADFLILFFTGYRLFIATKCTRRESMAGEQEDEDGDAEIWNKMLFGNGYCKHLLRRDRSHQLQRDEDDDDDDGTISEQDERGGRTPFLCMIFFPFFFTMNKVNLHS